MQKLPIDVQTIVCSFLTLDDVLRHFDVADVASNLTDWDERADKERLVDLVDVFNAEGVCQNLAQRVMRGEIMRRRLEREFLLDETMYARVMLDMSFGGDKKWTVDVHVATDAHPTHSSMRYHGYYQTAGESSPVFMPDSRMTERDFSKRVFDVKSAPTNRACVGKTYAIPGKRGGPRLFIFKDREDYIKVVTREYLVDYFTRWSLKCRIDFEDLLTLTPEEFVQRVNTLTFKRHLFKQRYEVCMPEAETTILCVYWRMIEIDLVHGYANIPLHRFNAPMRSISYFEWIK